MPALGNGSISSYLIKLSELPPILLYWGFLVGVIIILMIRVLLIRKASRNYMQTFPETFVEYEISYTSMGYHFEEKNKGNIGHAKIYEKFSEKDNSIFFVILVIFDQPIQMKKVGNIRPNGYGYDALVKSLHTHINDDLLCVSDFIEVQVNKEIRKLRIQYEKKNGSKTSSK